MKVLNIVCIFSFCDLRRGFRTPIHPGSASTGKRSNSFKDKTFPKHPLTEEFQPSYYS